MSKRLYTYDVQIVQLPLARSFWGDARAFGPQLGLNLRVPLAEPAWKATELSVFLYQDSFLNDPRTVGVHADCVRLTTILQC